MGSLRFTKLLVLRGALVAVTLCMAASLARAQTISAPATVTGSVNSAISVTATATGGGFITLTQANNAPFLTGASSAGPVTNPSITLTGTPSFCQAGTYTITWTCGGATATTIVTVMPLIPSCSPGQGYQSTLGASICFVADPFVAPCAGPNTYSWDFGDGTTGSGQQVCHTYATCGHYDVRLIVLDTKYGVSSGCRTTADVTFPCQATVARCPSSPSPINLNSSPYVCVTLRAVGACFLPSELGIVTMTYGGRSIASDARLSTPTTCPTPGTVCFRKADFVSLFSSLANGRSSVIVTLSGTLGPGSHAGCGFQAVLLLDIQK